MSFDRRHSQAGDAQLISVVFNDDIAAVRDFYAKNGGDYPVVNGDQGRMALDYSVIRVPDTYIIDPLGIVRARIPRPVQNADELDQTITALSAKLYGSSSSGSMKLKLSYGLMAIVLVGALWAGTHRNRVPSSEERAQALEHTIKCPVCRGQSVAESDSPAAKDIRIEITRRISDGESDAEIRSFFAQTLGADLLLRPASSGFAGLVWVLPVAGFVLAASGIAFAFVRWRRWARLVPVTKRVVRLDPDALAVLEEQRSFLKRSLADLEREHDAGDLESDDYEVLKHDYEARLASVSRAVDEGKAEIATSVRPARRRARR